MNSEHFDSDKEHDEIFEGQQLNQRGRGPSPEPPGRGGPPFGPPGFNQGPRGPGGPPPGPPGFNQGPRGPGGPPPGPPGFNQGPRGPGNQPPSAPPPNFIPEAPRTGAQPFAGAPEYGAQFGRGSQSPHRNLWICMNRFTYIWLINGNNFWFYPVFVGWQHMEGFRWRNGRWEYERINLRRILFFSCF